MTSISVELSQKIASKKKGNEIAQLSLHFHGLYSYRRFSEKPLTLDVHPFPIHVVMFGERTLLLVTHLLRKSLFISAKRTNHRPPSPGYRKSRAKRELSGSLDVEAIMVVNA